jgi:hypothetical protein
VAYGVPTRSTDISCGEIPGLSARWPLKWSDNRGLGAIGTGLPAGAAILSVPLSTLLATSVAGSIYIPWIKWGLAVAIFRCIKCGGDDDTALCNYWSARLRELPTVCSACDPKIGKWHGEFPQRHETPNPRNTSRAVRSLVGLTRLADVGVRLAEATREMAIVRRERI